MVAGADRVPELAGWNDQAFVPDMDELRVALRPPELPLPAPRTLLEAAHRVRDLTHAERLREASALAAAASELPGTAADAAQLAAAHLTVLAAIGTDEQIDQAAAELAGATRRAGHGAQAEAVVSVLAERGVVRLPQPRRGRRHLQDAGIAPELLAVVRALDLPTHVRRGRDADADAAQVEATEDPRRRLREVRAALDALESVRDQVLGDVRPVLELRCAQALEALGRGSQAVTAALDALEHLEEQQEHAGDPHRVAVAARAVLARTLSASRPAEAVRHAVDALGMLHHTEDPPLRIGIITDLLNALVATGLEPHTSFTAGRLASLQRALRRDDLRIAPLLAVAAQRLRAQRPEAAEAVLAEVRRIARDLRDRHASLETARLAAMAREARGDARGALAQLRQVAADAHWLCDDLATPASQRGGLLRTELEAQALVMRRALDLGQTSLARSAARAVERRTRPDGGRPLLSAPLLWDHRVDARIGELVAVAAALAAGDGAVTPADIDRLDAEAAQVIELVPDGHAPRAAYWRAYLAEQRALARERADDGAGALEAAQEAVELWGAAIVAEQTEQLRQAVGERSRQAQEHRQAQQSAAVDARASDLHEDLERARALRDRLS